MRSHLSPRVDISKTRGQSKVRGARLKGVVWVKFFFYTESVWNGLPEVMMEADAIVGFKRLLVRQKYFQSMDGYGSSVGREDEFN